MTGGEVWLVLSDLAEHLGLRSRGELLELFERAGLKIAGRSDAVPTHPRAQAAREEPSVERGDSLAAARALEVTSLWRLR